MVLRLVRNASWVLIALLIVGFGVFAALREAPPTTAPRTETVELKPVAGIGGPFSLIDQNGGTFTEASLQGRPTLLFFGYTFCPDVCPTTLLEAETWMKELGADADRLRVVFVSVDPERDTPEKLKVYLSNFDPRFIGLSGSRAETDRVIKAWRVVARKVDNPGSDYTMDHTAAVYLLDAQGRFVGIINFQEATDKAMAKIRRLLAAG
ncbi:MAG: SCO family protein [Siculibacillus sp.]